MLITALLSSAFAAIPGATAPWEPLASNPVPVDCATIDGVPWCRSRGVIPAPPDQVASALEDMRKGSSGFESVLSVVVLEPDTVHVVLDYPAPLTDRDYVAKYSRAEADGGALSYTWTPVVHANAPVTESPVRLPNYEGEWLLSPSGSDKTLVTYTWQAEINGSFPKWGYKTAWKKAGHEALKDLASTQGGKLSAP